MPPVMKRLLRIALFACALTAPLTAFAQPAPRATPVGVGDIAPEFTLPDQDGRTHTLAAERGRRAVVLIFYRGHW
jgi:peroxiredoxin Q/BCP